VATYESRPLAALAIGDQASYTRVLQASDIARFAMTTGDINPLHLDADFARAGRFHGIVGHGLWTAALISAVLGTRLPGPGTIYLSQSLRFLRPVFAGDVLTASVCVQGISAHNQVVTLACEVLNQRGQCVLNGIAEVMAPREKVAWTAPPGLLAEGQP
jgi:phosphate acetyltransferase/phosphate butyryltransferase